PTLLLSADQTQPIAGQSVTFTGNLQPAQDVQVGYLFDWGDGTRSGWSSSSTAIHSFGAARTYNVMLIARIGDPIEGGTQMLRSRPLAINVQPIIVQPPIITHRLILTSNASRVQVGQAANFSGELRPPADGVRYRFIWGDQTVSNVTSDPNADHSYSSAGAYPVQLVAQVGREQVQSNTLLIEVRNITRYLLDLSANVSEISAGQSIDFSARLQPPNDAARYEFVWDDGTPRTTTSSTTVSHSFTSAGTHTIGLTGIVEGRRVQSNGLAIAVLPLLTGVSLTANPSSVDVKQSVTFQAAIQPEDVRVEYQFDWGDGSRSDWSSSASMTHVYKDPRTYSAFVTA